jgi:hypothetical protein
MSLDESIYSSSMIRVAGAVRNILQLGVRLTRAARLRRIPWRVK